MSDDIRLERLLADVLAASAPKREPDRLVPEVLAIAGRTRRRPRWLALLKEPPMRLSSRIAVGSPTVRLATFIVMSLLLMGLVVGTLVAGANLLPKPTPPIPAAVVVPTPTSSIPAVSLPPQPTPPIPADRGTFSPTGSLSLGRWQHTVTLLRDGRVLVVGGREESGPETTASAELWDPATGRFSPTGSLGQARAHHSSTLLRDGRVLIVGGIERSEIPLASAELWDPSTGLFSPTGSLAAARAGQTATLLRDGRVLVVGGSGGFLSAEVWDPSTGRFSPTGSPATPRVGHTATLLADGRVLVVGGTGDPGRGDVAPRSRGEADSPIVSGPVAAGEPVALDQPHTVAYVTLAVAQWDAGPVAGRYAAVIDRPKVASAEVWDPTTGLFSPAGSLALGRERHTASLLADGRVLIAGGVDTTDIPLVSAELWDPATATFSRTGSMVAGRVDHSATPLTDGRILMVGGTSNVLQPDAHPPAFAELYDPGSGTFAATGSSLEQASPATLLLDGRVLFAGGWGGAAIASAELFELR